MNVTKGAVVRLRIETFDERGGRIGEQELVYLHGGYGNLFPKLESALAGLAPGAEVKVRLAPADGFGERDPALVRREPRERLPRDVALGMELHGDDEDQPAFRVTALDEAGATLDANHPLAGRTVELRCAVLEVRAATPDEIAHGHVHGPEADHSH